MWEDETQVSGSVDLKQGDPNHFSYFEVAGAELETVE